MPRQVDIRRINRRGKNFSVELFSGNQNITKFLKSVQIVHSSTSIWPQIFISMNIDANDLILNDFYGQKTLSLVIYASGEETDLVERTILHLLYLESNINLITKLEQSLDQQIDRQPTTIATIPIFSSNIMTAFVNDIFEENDSVFTPVDFIENKLAQLGFTDLDIDKRGKNEDTIDQFVIPPMSVRQLIDYMDNYFYFYQGPLFRFADAFGKFKMWNLHEKIKEDPKVVVYQPPSYAKSDKFMNQLFVKTLDGKNFLTRDPIQTIYHGNANILKYGYDVVYTTHPSNNLYHHVVDNMDNIAQNFSVCDPDGDKQIKIHPNMKARKKYYHDTSGNDNSNILKSRMSEKIQNLSGLRIALRRNVLMTNIFRIGEPIEFIPTTHEYMSYRGKYILESSTYLLNRDETDNWDSVCFLNLSRTNQSLFNQINTSALDLSLR